MRILFIKLRHIGDSLLLTPAIVATREKFPEAEIWVLVRRSCESILEGCPEIDRILTTANPDASKRRGADWISDLRVAALLRRTRFDHVFELTDNDRARFFAIAARTPSRCTNEHRTLRRFWRPFFNRIESKKRYGLHQVQRDYTAPASVLGLPRDEPSLRFANERQTPWPGFQSLPAGPLLVIHPSTRWKRKEWPLDRWERLILQLKNLTPAILLSCGPGSDERRESVALANRTAVFSTQGAASWAELAWLLARARLFVGVDTAAMHLAAATCCPTVCLFGPSPDFEYHPWKVEHRMIRPQSWLAESELKNAEALMSLIPVERVTEACHRMWTVRA